MSAKYSTIMVSSTRLITLQDFVVSITMIYTSKTDFSSVNAWFGEDTDVAYVGSSRRSDYQEIAASFRPTVCSGIESPFAPSILDDDLQFDREFAKELWKARKKRGSIPRARQRKRSDPRSHHTTHSTNTTAASRRPAARASRATTSTASSRTTAETGRTNATRHKHTGPGRDEGKVTKSSRPRTTHATRATTASGVDK